MRPLLCAAILLAGPDVAAAARPTPVAVRVRPAGGDGLWRALALVHDRITE